MSIDYVHNVERIGGIAKTVICQDGNIKAIFRLKQDGRLSVTKVKEGATQGSAYIYKPVFTQMVRQAYGILKGGQS